MEERRSGEDRRSREVGDKCACPQCGHLVSTVIPRNLVHPESIYLRHRRCRKCAAEFETEERTSRLLKAGSIAA
jgi:DNA-directed RNA polymerase subunit RPC12/RpoP